MQSHAGSEPTETSPAPAPVRSPPPKVKVYSRYQLPSDRTPFSTHFDILARFVTHSRNGTEAIAAERVEGEGVPVQAAQMNVKFLTSIGLLKFDSKGLYVPTQETIRFVNAKTVEDDRARPILRALIETAWFAEIALGVLRTRPLVTDDALVGELALAAETNKEKKGPALRVLVEYLVWAGVLKRDERGLSKGEPGSDVQPAVMVPAWAGEPRAVSPPNASGERRGDLPTAFGSGGSDWHIVQTEDYFLKVRSDPDVIDDVRDQLQLLRKKVERKRTKAPAPGESATEPAVSPEA